MRFITIIFLMVFNYCWCQVRDSRDQEDKKFKRLCAKHNKPHDSDFECEVYDLEHTSSNNALINLQDSCDQVHSGTGMVLHFTKGDTNILETACDSIHFIVQAIHPKDTSVWSIIGIANAKTLEQKQLALNRAENVKKELVKRGISAKRLKVYHSLHPKPKKDEPKDWPYYPEYIPFEIGVFFMAEN